MARKLDLKQTGFDTPVVITPVFWDAEETWIRLTQQQKTSLALSPKLQEWFDKELRVRLRE